MRSTYILLASILIALAVGATVGRFTAPAQPAPRGNANACTCNLPPPDADNTVKTRLPVEKPDSETSSLGDVLASLKTRDAPTGKGVIAGLVATGDGAGLAGVEVKAIAVLPEPANARKRSLEDEVREVVERRRIHDAVDRSAMTDSTGNFKLTALADYPYQLSANKPGYRIEATTYAAEVKAGTSMRFMAYAAVLVRVDVTMSNGAPLPAGIKLAYTYTQGSRTSSASSDWNANSPELSLDVGEYKMLAFGGKDGEYCSEEVSFSVSLDQLPPTLKLVLDSKPGIRGRVLVSDEFTGLEYEVVCIRYEGEAPAEYDDQEVKGDKRFSVTADQKGGFRFSFLDLVPGNYALFLEIHGNTVLRELLTLARGVLDHDLAAPLPSRADYVVVRCYGPDGANLTDVSFYTGYDSRSRRSSGGEGEMLRARDGSFWVPHRDRSDLPEGEKATFYVTAVSPAYGDIQQTYDPASQAEVVIRFLEPARLVVTVAGFAQCDFQISLKVSLSRRDSDRSETRSAFNELGEIVFDQLAPGEYVVQLGATLKSDGDSRSTNINRLNVTLTSGENKATISIPTLYTLKVRLDPAKAKERLSLESGDRKTRFRLSARTDEAGVATFEMVPAGKYIVSREREFMTVTVPYTLEVTFAPMVVNAISIEITDPKGYAAGLGLLSGDLIIAVNGTEFTGIEQLSAELQKAMSGKSAKLTIQRGAGRIEVEADLNKLFSDGGASIAPASK